LSESDFIQALVLQFLQHDGYVDTARAFANEMKEQKEALNLDPNVKVDGVSIRDDEDAHNRQRMFEKAIGVGSRSNQLLGIRSAVLDGDIDRALKYTRTFYPDVLPDNEHVYFRLRCRKFIEMVRKAAQMNMALEPSKTNGHVGSAISQRMEIDNNGVNSSNWDENVEMGGIESQAEVLELERSMLEYGQTLQADYANDPRKEISKTLDEIWALVAYRNPLKEPQVSHLLDRKGRALVAEELNSAILRT
jgi:Ran-binding protein 9/10